MDDFERQQLGPDWEVLLPTNGQVQIIDDSDVGMIPGPQGFFLMNWRGSAFGPDQFCEAAYPVDATDGWAHMVYVRWRASDSARYGFAYDNDPNQAEFGNWILKYDGVPTSQVRIIASAPAVDIPGPGDTIRIEIEGFTMRGYLNDTLVITGTDTDPSRIADGQTGLAARWATGNQPTNSVVKVWESWGGGSLPSSAAATVDQGGSVLALRTFDMETGAVRTKTRLTVATPASVPRAMGALRTTVLDELDPAGEGIVGVLMLEDRLVELFVVRK